MYNVDVKNQEYVKAVLDLLKGIKVEELSPKQVQNIFENHEIWSQKVNYSISLYANSEIGVSAGLAAKGLVYILEEEKLIFVDPKTIVDSSENAQDIKRTFFYISKDKQADVIHGLVEIIEEAKYEFLN